MIYRYSCKNIHRYIYDISDISVKSKYRYICRNRYFHHCLCSIFLLYWLSNFNALIFQSSVILKAFIAWASSILPSKLFQQKGVKDHSFLQALVLSFPFLPFFFISFFFVLSLLFVHFDGGIGIPYKGVFFC